jgi:hypothetical protein
MPHEAPSKSSPFKGGSLYVRRYAEYINPIKHWFLPQDIITTRETVERG